MNEINWTEGALDNLASIYVETEAGLRNELVRAVEELEGILAERASIEGESRGGDTRIFFHKLLAVIYRAPKNEPVDVVEIRSNRRKRK